MAADVVKDKATGAGRYVPDCLDEGEVALSGMERPIRVTKEALEDGYVMV